MFRLKIAKILFLVGVLSFVARPFVGYALFGKSHHLVEDSILVKIFSKRKPELSEDNNFQAIEKKLANPGLDIYTLYSNFLDILFPATFPADTAINPHLSLALRPSSCVQTWLLCGKLII